MSTTSQKFVDPTANYTPQEKKLNEPTPINASSIAESRPQQAFGDNAGVQGGPSLAQQARQGAQMAYDVMASGVSSLTSGLPSTNTFVPGGTQTGTHEPQYRNNQPHVGGVGDLPGSSFEEGVAKLPEERAFEHSNSGVSGGLNRSSELDAARDSSSAGAGAPGFGQQQFDSNNMSQGYSKPSDVLSSYEGAAPAGANAPFKQHHDSQSRQPDTSLGAGYGINRDIGPGAGATNQGPSDISNIGSGGITTTSNTLPHHEQAISDDSAVTDHPGRLDHSTSGRGGALDRAEDKAKSAAAGLTGTHAATGTRHTDSTFAANDNNFQSNDVNDRSDRDRDNTSSNRGGAMGRVEQGVKRTEESTKSAAAGITGSHTATGTRHHDSTSVDNDTNMSNPNTDNNSSPTLDTSHHTELGDESGTPSSPSKMDKLKGALIMKKGQIFKDEEAVRQGENLKTTGMKFPDLGHK